MIGLEAVYIIAGLFFVAVSILSIGDPSNKRSSGNALFWALLAGSFLFGSYLSDFQNGLLVLAIVLLGGLGALDKSHPQTTTPEQRRESAARRGNALFIPALIIPTVAVFGTMVLKGISINDVPLIEAKNVTLVSLTFGALLALIVAMLWLRPPALAPLNEGRRLVDTIGWAALLPQMLASLGAVFALAHVGDAVGLIATHYIPLENAFVVVAVYCMGMALFTAIMGNAFAAFPVMTAAIGLPLLIHNFGGDPAIVGAIGMLSGFCGTLTTPMAANFNVVPAALLELPDRDGVIKIQIPTAIPLLVCNIVLMYVLLFVM